LKLWKELGGAFEKRQLRLEARKRVDTSKLIAKRKPLSHYYSYYITTFRVTPLIPSRGVTLKLGVKL